ncbi:MAG: aminoacyl-tRNA hydrolase [Acidobacteria bacterium]|nr:MAG: aminoacyl-tRNA hydrolase [Acidobacteriota bacterium]
MKAIVGLGNPGSEYQGTRHNVGFEVVDELARRWNAKLKKWKSIADVVIVKDRDVVLVEPKTYMNLSGQAVGAVMAFYRIEPADVLVIVDEVQLPLGRLRLRPSGSAGGHNGLKSVIEHVGSDFPRLRIGVDRGHPDWDLSDRVLSKFPPGERDIVGRAITRAADAVETFVSDGIHAAMNRFNTAEDQSTEEETRS